MQISVFYDHILQAAGQEHLAVSEILKKVREFKIEALECSYECVKGQEDSMKQLFDEAGMSVSCLYATFQLDTETDCLDAYSFIDSAILMDAPKVLIIPGFVAEDASSFVKKTAMEKMAVSLNKICDYARKYSIVVTMEDYDDMIAPYSTDDELVWFMEHVPELRCTFDTGNFQYQEIDVLQAFLKLSDRIVHVHCKDRALAGYPNEGAKITTGGNSLYASPVGCGIIPMKEIFALLKETGYDGTFAIEHFDASRQLAFMKQSADWINGNY